MTEAATTETPEFLTVKELAERLRLKERKVYDMAASGAVPCSRATGKLLFPKAEIDAWLAASSKGSAKPATDRPGVFLGSHDPLLEWALRQSRCGLATFFDGSMDGLTRLRSGEGMAAGLHLHDAASGDWNVPAVQSVFAGNNMVLVGFATRQRGLVVAPALADKITALADLKGRRVTLRQSESGTARIFASQLADAGLSLADLGSTEEARSEMDAVLSISQGHADATFGLEPLARQFHLAFVPVVTERFDLLVDRKAWFDEPMQTFLNFCQSPDFATRAKAHAGYDVSDFGRVRWNG